MKEKELIQFLKEAKKSDLTIKNTLESLRIVEKYLTTKYDDINLENITREHLIKFLEDNRDVKRIGMHIGALIGYYEIIGDRFRYNLAREIRGIELLERYQLKNFHLVNLDYIERLKEIGIKTAKQMLDAGLTKENRKAIAAKSDIPEDYILELVKLSNLARISGLKKIRARLYYDAGIDTLRKLETWIPLELKELLDDHVKKTGIAKMGPLLAECSSAIALAKHLPKIVEF